jgi:hypothetical protein
LIGYSANFLFADNSEPGKLAAFLLEECVGLKATDETMACEKTVR